MKPNLKLLAGLLTLFIATEAHAMRWYSPSTGGWFSRDPIEERGGHNLYGFVGNDPVRRIDAYGLFWFLTGCSPRQCCECVTGITLKSAPLNTPGPLGGLEFGHTITYTVSIIYKPCKNSGTATMQYLEKMDLVPADLAAKGVVPGETADTYALFPDAEGFGSWTHRNAGKSIPCSGSSSRTITDTPKIGTVTSLTRDRTLATTVVFTNPDGCPSKKISKDWSQHLRSVGDAIEIHELK